MRWFPLAIVLAAGVARAQPAPERPAAYVDLIPIAVSLLPDSGRFVQLYGELPVRTRWSAIAVAVSGYADHATLAKSTNRYDLLGTGIGVGARFYAWNPFHRDHAGCSCRRA